MTEFNFRDFYTVFNHPGFLRDQPTVVFHYSVSQALTTPEVLDVVNSYAGNTAYNFVLIHYANANIVSTGVSVTTLQNYLTKNFNFYQFLECSKSR